jgi:hypothetical protein
MPGGLNSSDHVGEWKDPRLAIASRINLASQVVGLLVNLGELFAAAIDHRDDFATIWRTANRNLELAHGNCRLTTAITRPMIDSPSRRRPAALVHRFVRQCAAQNSGRNS